MPESPPPSYVLELPSNEIADHHLNAGGYLNPPEILHAHTLQDNANTLTRDTLWRLGATGSTRSSIQHPAVSAIQEAARERKPFGPTMYTFSPLSSDSMLLIPPASDPDSRPRYYISVRTNCFTPSSWITSVHRGGSENGEFVGDFEMGIVTFKKPNTVCIHETEFVMKDVFNHNQSANGFNCNLPRCDLFWDISEFKCYDSRKPDRKLLAKFIPATGLRQPGKPAQLARLILPPHGQEYFDEILLTALIVERKRTSPTTFDLRRPHQEIY